MDAPGPTIDGSIELERLSRLYAALSQINQAIVRMPSREELLNRVCEILVAAGGFTMAWVGWHAHDSHRLMPVASAGDARGYLREIAVYTDDRPEGRGPSGTAFRENRPYICNDAADDPATGPWREAFARHGFGASAVFPITVAGRPEGTLTVYAAEPHRFQRREIMLLAEAAADLSFALDNLDREIERRRLDAEARQERTFSDTFVESMPGVVYVYDEHRRFLRSNGNFATVSGYTVDEIAGMHPLDFFTPAHRPAVEAAIAEVFRTGESSVEAPFLTRDGSEIDYFFTGRRVLLDDVPCLVGTGVDISQRKRAERQLADSERKYRELVELANSIILRWDASGRITFLNEFGQRFFGYSEAEVLGRDVMGTLVPLTDSGGQDLAQQMANVRTDPASFEQNVNENIKRSGERVWISWTNHVIQGDDGEIVEILSVGTDISQRRQVEIALQTSEERYRKTLDSILEGCQLIAFDWTYLYLNDAAQTQNRRPNHELLGRTMLEAWPGIDQTEVFALLRDCMEQRRPHHAEVPFTFGDGGTGWFDVRCQPAPEGVFVLSIDITERRRAEDALHQLNENLERQVRERTEELRVALMQAESADRAKSAFLATMSHELRTPLNSIIGFTGIILQGLAGPLNEEQAKQLGMVRASATHLHQLINEILDLSKIEAGQMEVEHRPVDAPAMVAHVVGVVAPMARKRGLALQVSVAPEVGELSGDRRRLEQILLNLLNNAIKFTDEGVVTLDVALVPDYKVGGVGPAREVIRFRVIDTGIGIAAADLGTLFQPFRQVDSGLTRQHEGTGLGLAICRRLVTLMDGEIGVESVRGAGSVFTAVVPTGREVSS
jgi:PAS domain S-box-containing protein